MLRKLPTTLGSGYVCQIQAKRNSALFINGAKATEVFTYVTPHIDFSERLKDRENLLQQIRRRKHNFDLDKFENLWTVYEELKVRKSELDNSKKDISAKLGALIKSKSEDQAIQKYKIQINLFKDNIKKLKSPLWSAEEAAVLEGLKLPNNLHPLTPDKDNVLYTHLSPPNNKKDHLKIGKDLDLFTFKKNENYYLKGDAAIFELGAKFYFNKLLRSNGFTQFSNPDFVKSLILEGCGEDHTNPNTSFILHHNEDTKINVDNRLHLTGGASLSSFFAYHTKNVLYPKAFPLKYFSMGRQYVPAPSEEDSLFHVSQSSVVQIFGAAKNSNELDTLLEEWIDILKSAYIDLGYHFRLSILPADKLCMWESLRVSLEMFSTSLNNYVEVANVSVSGDFISKRLMFTYVENKESKFPFILSGTLLNVPRFLGCVLEQNEDFVLADHFKVENWK